MTPAIICGGQGTRLWPVSRATYPKPFCDLMSETLINQTIKRLTTMGEPWLITSGDLKGLTLRLFRELKLDPKKVLFEPVPKNTAPAIALITQVFMASKRGGEVIGIFPADHLVENQKTFLNALKLAEKCANDGMVCTVGIKPTYPATGYGYIEVVDKTVSAALDLKAFQVASFREKPDIKTAEKFIQEGRFFWNGGIFVFKAETMAKAFAEHMPTLWKTIGQLKADLSNLKEVYQSIDSQSTKSIDYGVMEKLKNQVCIPCDLGWSDVGSWDEVSKYSDGSESNTVGDKSGTNWFYSSKKEKILGVVDVEDLLVVDTADALLISKKGSSQKVNALVKELEKSKPVLTREHVFDFRPWGAFETLGEDKGFKVKVIRVDPGQQFSYQSHNKRSEHWVIVRGEPVVVLEGKDHKLKPGDYIFIPLKAKHRMRNEGTEPVEFVEVQAGPYLGEDDIIRYDDDYGR